MRVIKEEGHNNYSLKQLTIGKLLAIHRALALLKESGKGTALSEDVLIQLERELKSEGQLVDVVPPTDTTIIIPVKS